MAQYVSAVSGSVLRPDQLRFLFIFVAPDSLFLYNVDS